MRKRIIAFLLVAAVVIGITPLMSTGEGSGAATGNRGDYTYTLSADPDTGTVPDGFGTVASNGRIWTDKSVSVNGDAFDVDLRVLAQEYISTYGSAESTSIAADVVMVLDFTTSMYKEENKIPKDDGTKVTRFQALVDSVNEAIDIITNTNDNNRISVYAFFGGGSNNNSSFSCINIMPLAHYTSTSTSEDTTDKYIHVTQASNGYRADSSAGLLKDGEAWDGFQQSCNQGTNTQYGIANGVQGLINDINAETDNSINRKPYVIVLTDGEPTTTDVDWYDTASNLTGRDENVSNPNNATDEDYIPLIAPTILTAAVYRDRLDDAYTAYNEKSYGVEWFNIGLGVGEEVDSAGVLVNPAFLRNVTPNANGTTAEKIKYDLVQKAADYASKDYSADDNYIYPNEGDGYVTFANTYSVLKNAFTTLANIIKEGSQTYTVPIVNHEGSGEQNSDVVFTDVIGEGMFIDGIRLTPNGKAPVEGNDDDGDGTYTFAGYKTTVTVTEDANGQQTLRWQLPADEVAMYTFADREDVTNGEYVAADPTRLTVRVDYTEEIGEGTAYTNAFDGNTPLTTVTYEIPGDNDYYFDVQTDEFFNFVSSTLKTDTDSTTPKTENTTGSCTDSHSYTHTEENGGTENASAVANGTLGNNGKVTFLMRRETLELTVEKLWEDRTGETITDTSGLPDVEVTLYRSVQGGEEETVDVATLSSQNGYTKSYTLPIRDNSDRRYSYYISEDCPEGYYIHSISQPVEANDATLTVINREFPEDGLISIRKQWVDKLGASLNGASLQPIDINLMRQVTAYTPAACTVTITCKDSGNTTVTLATLNVEKGSTLSFELLVSATRKNNAGNMTIRRNNTTVSSSMLDEARTVRVGNNSYSVWYRKTVTQSFTVTEDMTLAYTSSQQFNTYINNEDKACFETDTLVYTESSGGNEPVTEKYDEVYETVTLNTANRWNALFEDVPVSETVDGTTYSYKYFVEEITDVPGFTASYSDNNEEGIEGGVLVITNTSTAPVLPLPETGGEGTAKIITAGAASAALAVTGAFVLLLTEERKRKRGSPANQ